jgi:hypothetical protein
MRLAFARIRTATSAREFFADANGEFRLSLDRAGSVALHVRQIGYTPLDTVLSVTGTAEAVSELRLRKLPAFLEPVVIPGVAACRLGNGPKADSALAAVLTALNENAQRERLLATRYPFDAIYRRTTWYLDPAGKVQLQQADTVTAHSAGYQAYQPGGVLKRSRSSYTLNVPGLADLADSSFGVSHCFRFGGLDTADGQAALRIDFTHSDQILTPDVNGSAWIAARSGLLLKILVEVTGLPPGLTFSNVREEKTYGEILPGLLVIDRTLITQQLSRVMIGHTPVAQAIESQAKLNVHFTGAAPGSLQRNDGAHAASGAVAWRHASPRSSTAAIGPVRFRFPAAPRAPEPLEIESELGGM